MKKLLIAAVLLGLSGAAYADHHMAGEKPGAAAEAKPAKAKKGKPAKAKKAKAEKKAAAPAEAPKQ